MARCTQIQGLEVHHKSRYGGKGLSNAQVLCQACHEATPTYGVSGPEPPPFDEMTKQVALENAGKQCECIQTGGCH